MNPTKKNKLIILLAILGIAGFSVLYATAGIFKTNRQAVNDLTSGLVGYWTLDGQDTNWGTNTTIDRSTSGYTGTMLNNVSTSTSPVSGVIGQGMKFAGNGNCVSFGNASNLQFQSNSSPFSVSFFVKVNSLSAWSGVVAKRATGADGDFGWEFTQNANGTYYFGKNDGAENAMGITSTTGITVNNWYHITGTYDGTGTSGFKIYVNGVSEGTSGGTLISPVGGIGNAGIGHRNCKVGRTTSFNGSVDEVRIYNRALSASEATDLYNQGAKRFIKTNASPTSGLTGGLVGYWTFDGQDINWTSATAGTVADRSGLSNTGTMANLFKSTSPVSGMLGQALNFDGTSDYVDFGNDSDFNFEWSDPFSISAWVYQPSTPGSRISSIFYKYTGGATSKGYWFWINKFDSSINFLLRHADTNPGNIYANMSASTIFDRWAHLVATNAGTGNSSGLNIYIDGVLQSPTKAGGPLSGANTIKNTDSAYIGGTGIGNPDFKIDEVRVYNRALSATEAKELYNMGAKKLVKTNMPDTNKFTGGLVGYWTMNGQDTTWSTATTGTVADKSSAGTNTGILNNMSQSTSPVSGVVGQALKFNGSNNFIGVNYSASLAPTTAISYGAWFKTNDKTADQRILSKTETGGYNINLNSAAATTWCGNPNVSLCSIIYLSGAYNGVKYAVSNLSNNIWYHAFTTYDGNTLRLYVNGVQVDSKAVAGGVIQYSSSNPLCIGQEATEVTCTTGGLNGSLDEVRVYNRALSASEVLELYQSGVGR